MKNHIPLVAFAAALVAVAGCFDEPTPASKSVPAEQRVYLSDKGLTELPAVTRRSRVSSGFGLTTTVSLHSPT